MDFILTLLVIGTVLWLGYIVGPFVKGYQAGQLEERRRAAEPKPSRPSKLG